MDERDFYDEKDAKKSHTLNCPHCREANEYELSWLVRTKKKQLPGRADERDRAKFAKARTYMVRRDDMVMCKIMRCRKRFEVAGGGAVGLLALILVLSKTGDWVIGTLAFLVFFFCLFG